MPMWRCPHCGTPQAETARCWVCRRSSTACGTCRHFRRAVAGQLGYCGLDRQRQPLHGDEIRACWEARPVALEVPAPVTRTADGRAIPVDIGRTPVRRLDFVEVDGQPLPTRHATSVNEPGSVPEEGPVISASTDPGWSLWGDAEF